MPDITGWSVSEVNTLCKLLNLKLKTIGYGNVKTSSIKAGTTITEGTNIEVVFE